MANFLENLLRNLSVVGLQEVERGRARKEQERVRGIEEEDRAREIEFDALRQTLTKEQIDQIKLNREQAEKDRLAQEQQRAAQKAALDAALAAGQVTQAEYNLMAAGLDRVAGSMIEQRNRPAPTPAPRQPTDMDRQVAILADEYRRTNPDMSVGEARARAVRELTARPGGDSDSNVALRMAISEVQRKINAYKRDPADPMNMFGPSEEQWRKQAVEDGASVLRTYGRDDVADKLLMHFGFAPPDPLDFTLNFQDSMRGGGGQPAGRQPSVAVGEPAAVQEHPMKQKVEQILGYPIQLTSTIEKVLNTKDATPEQMAAEIRRLNGR